MQIVDGQIIHYNAGRRFAAPENFMRSKDFLDLAKDPNFISGIYNYCDRWCERCAFTSRCFLYATEKSDPDLDDPEVGDITNAKFWRKLALIFKDTHDLIKTCAEEAGVDLDAIEAEAAIAEHDREREVAEKHELSVLAREYAQMVEQWFATELPDEPTIYTQGARPDAAEKEIDAAAAIEIIRWYQFFIATKTFRALLKDDDDLSEEDLESDGETVRDATQNDSNGSAKVALIAIDRSLSSWRLMQNFFPDKQASTAPLMATLEKLRNGIESVLPAARDFVRPGFDEVESEFLS
jgi:hypothetical protein